MKNDAKIIRSLPLYIGLVFLFNPNITVIDPLPDFIGYILVCFALYRLCDLNGELTEAYESFKRMALIDAGKILAVLWIFGMSVPSERNTSVLLFTFLFSLFELIVLIPAYTKLFSGFVQLGYRFPSEALFGNGQKGSRTDTIRNLTYAFVIVKSVLTVLPEFADLTNYSYDETTTSFVNLYRYIGIMRFLAMIPVVVLGIVWLVCLISYFHRIKADKDLISSLEQKYKEDVLPKKGIFVRRGFKTFSLVLTVALLLTVDIRLDNINMVPDFLAAAFLIIAVILLKKHCGQKIIVPLALSVALLPTSVAAAIFENKFFDRYYYSAIIKSDAARNAYTLMSVLNGVKSVLTVIVLAGICYLLVGIIKNHTGYVLGMERGGEQEKKMIDQLHKERITDLKYAVAAFALYAVSDICYDIFAPKFAYIGLINFAFAALGIGFFIRAISAIKRAVDTKYMLE